MTKKERKLLAKILFMDSTRVVIMVMCFLYIPNMKFSFRDLLLIIGAILLFLQISVTTNAYVKKYVNQKKKSVI